MLPHLPNSLLAFLVLALPGTLSYASPSPALVSEEYIHLIPRHTLFLRQSNDLQTFSGQLGGIRASPIISSGDDRRPFQVEGDTFTDFNTAAQRSCDRQANSCSQSANEQGNGQFKVGDCDRQKQECNNAQNNAPVKDFQTGVASTNIGPDPDFPDFDLICDA
ncbi:hypothetical protein B0J11DRAFT_579952 [Dendryphion nanum]|uniref:Uncharacterized protein n=1 Tax=Dendryphion nanum TaxID=256645 RepID=A0A9P9IM05_9PLEO|nr:hypothetical protein B0J11DRAFT_579952 [Dendryphion nanum]